MIVKGNYNVPNYYLNPKSNIIDDTNETSKRIANNFLIN